MMMLRHALLAAGAALALSACAAGPALFGPSTGSVTGHVTVRSCGGANEEMQSACHLANAPGARVTFQAVGSQTPLVATSDASGVYVIQLKPGTYEARLTVPRAVAGTTLMPNDAFARGLSSPKTITVVAGKTVRADFSYTMLLL